MGQKYPKEFRMFNKIPSRALCTWGTIFQYVHLGDCLENSQFNSGNSMTQSIPDKFPSSLIKNCTTCACAQSGGSGHLWS